MTVVSRGPHRAQLPALNSETAAARSTASTKRPSWSRPTAQWIATTGSCSQN